jgi:hypothetical protein
MNSKPTRMFRWAEMEDKEIKNTPNVTIVDYGTCYFKLQQCWVCEDGTKEWIDIPVKYIPLE